MNKPVSDPEAVATSSSSAHAPPAKPRPVSKKDVSVPHRLAPWYSLEEAALRLSTTSGDQMTVEVLLQLVAQGDLPLSWRVSGHYAHSVAQWCALSDFAQRAWESNAEHTDYETKPYWADYTAYREARESGRRDPWAYLEWFPFGQDTVDDVPVTGMFRFHLDHDRLRTWIFQLIGCGRAEAPAPGQELCLSDSQGDMWSFTERLGLMDRFQPRRRMPAAEELGFQRGDIEAFESQISEQAPKVEPSPPPKDSTRESNNLRRIIGLMVNQKYAKEIGSPYSIAALLADKAAELEVKISKEAIAGHIKAALELLRSEKK